MPATITPLGFYLAHEAGRLAGVSGDRIGQWARRGYIRSSQSTGQPRVYSYQDVAEAMVVHELDSRGFGLNQIRNTIEGLRDEYGDWPLQDAILFADQDRGRVMVLEHSEFFDVGREKMRGTGILKYTLTDLQRVARDLRRGGWAARAIEDLEHIEVNPERMSGRPAITGRRIEAEFVGTTAKLKGGRRLLRTDYELTDPEIHDAVRWWDQVQEYEAAA